MNNLILALMLNIGVVTTSIQEAPQTVVDQQRPLALILNDTERLLKFDGPVAFAARDTSGNHRISDYLLIHNLSANVLLDAQRAFPPMRVEVIRRDVNRRYLLDLEHVEGDERMADLAITDHIADIPVVESDLALECYSADCISDPRALLIRFAAQWFNGPQTLVTNLPNLNRLITPQHPPIGGVEGLQFRSVGQWQWRGYQLDVVRASNSGQDTVILDPRSMTGPQPGAVISAQRWSLDPSGRPGSFTLIYLVQEVSR